MTAHELLLVTAVAAWIVAPLFLLLLEKVADWLDAIDTRRAGKPRGPSG